MIYSTNQAFAAVLQEETVVTWGPSNNGRDSRPVSEALVDVGMIYSRASAFAAVLQDGTVVSWGSSLGGGD